MGRLLFATLFRLRNQPEVLGLEGFGSFQKGRLVALQVTLKESHQFPFSPQNVSHQQFQRRKLTGIAKLEESGRLNSGLAQQVRLGRPRQEIQMGLNLQQAFPNRHKLGPLPGRNPSLSQNPDGVAGSGKQPQGLQQRPAAPQPARPLLQAARQGINTRLSAFQHLPVVALKVTEEDDRPLDQGRLEPLLQFGPL